MRFIANGPVIPDQLLADREAGRVVFLCGAGVSVPTMPNFAKLTLSVINDYAPELDPEIEKAFAPWNDKNNGVPTSIRVPLDQIFYSLQEKYGRDRVGSKVARQLTLSGRKEIQTEHHKIIGRLSANREGVPQIVTTNFDHLFEHALGSRLERTYTPPTFPDLHHNMPVTGITYLHGRLAEPDDEIHDYVLSSADFGRAYLAEGWATLFIRQLLKDYTVVLVGYQAEDPPVKYLLQGLNSSSSLMIRS